MCRAHGHRGGRRNGRSIESAPFSGTGPMGSCMVGHKCGSRQWPGFRSFCSEAFSSSLAPTSREIGARLLVRPKYPVLVSVICTPTAEQTVSVLAMHLVWDFRPGLREGRTSCGRLHPAPGCLSRQTSSRCCERRPAAQINRALAASLGRTVCNHTVFTVMVGCFPLFPLQFLHILFK